MLLHHAQMETPLEIPKSLETCVFKFYVAFSKEQEEFHQFASVAELINYQMLNFKSFNSFSKDTETFLADIAALENNIKLSTNAELIDENFPIYSASWKTKLSDKNEKIKNCKLAWDCLQLRSATTRKPLLGEENNTKAIILKTTQGNRTALHKHEEVTILGESTNNPCSYRVQDADGLEAEVSAINLLRANCDQHIKGLISKGKMRIRATMASVQSTMETQFWSFIEHYLLSRSKKDFIVFEKIEPWTEVMNYLRSIRENNCDNFERYLQTIKANVVVKKLPGTFSITNSETQLLNEICKMFASVIKNIQAVMDSTSAQLQKSHDSNSIDQAFKLAELQSMRQFIVSTATQSVDTDSAFTIKKSNKHVSDKFNLECIEESFSLNNMSNQTFKESVTSVSIHSHQQMTQSSKIKSKKEVISSNDNFSANLNLQSAVSDKKCVLVNNSTQTSVFTDQTSKLNKNSTADSVTIQKRLTALQRSTPKVTDSGAEATKTYTQSNCRKKAQLKQNSCEVYSSVATSSMHFMFRKPLMTNGVGLDRKTIESNTRTAVKEMVSRIHKYKQKTLTKESGAEVSTESIHKSMNYREQRAVSHTTGHKEMQLANQGVSQLKESANMTFRYKEQKPVTATGGHKNIEQSDHAVCIGKLTTETKLCFHEEKMIDVNSAFYEIDTADNMFQFQLRYPIESKGISRDLDYEDNNIKQGQIIKHVNTKTLRTPLVDNGVFRINESVETGTEMSSRICDDTGAFHLTRQRHVKLQSVLRTPQVECGVGGNLSAAQSEISIQTAAEKVWQRADSGASGSTLIATVMKNRGTDTTVGQNMFDTGACASSHTIQMEKITELVAPVTATNEKKRETLDKGVEGSTVFVTQSHAKTTDKQAKETHTRKERVISQLEEDIQNLMINTTIETKIVKEEPKIVVKNESKNWRYPVQRTDFRPHSDSQDKPEIIFYNYEQAQYESIPLSPNSVFEYQSPSRTYSVKDNLSPQEYQHLDELRYTYADACTHPNQNYSKSAPMSPQTHFSRGNYHTISHSGIQHQNGGTDAESNKGMRQSARMRLKTKNMYASQPGVNIGQSLLSGGFSTRASSTKSIPGHRMAATEYLTKLKTGTQTQKQVIKTAPTQ